MRDETQNPDPGHEDILDGLLRECGQVQPSIFVRPSDAAILAYLNDTCTATQRSQIQRALLQSRSFRCELIEIASDLDDLERANAQAEFATIHVPPAPDPRQLGMKRHVKFCHAAEFLRSPLSPLSPSQFVPVLLRGEEVGAAETAEDAAVMSLARTVHWSDGTLRVLEDSEEITGDEGLLTTLVLRIRDRSDPMEREVMARIPDATGRCQAWLLLLPSFELYNVDMNESFVSALFPADMEGPACVTFTFTGERGYLATPAVVIR